MSRWRIVVLACLFVLPLLLLLGAGSYYLWTFPWGFLVWWLVLAFMAAGALLASYWQSKQSLIKPLDLTPAAHWTDRDREAWKIVLSRAKASAKVDPTKLTDLNTYVVAGQELAQEVTAVYHPGAKDPVGNLTIPEILAVIELVAHDLSEMTQTYVPASHLLTINHFRQAKSAADWYNSASTAFWAVSALFSPINTGLRYVATKLGVTTPLQMLQNNLILWFYSAFLNRVGTYLIDLNSGRLKLGAQRYRELVQGRPPLEVAAEGDGVDAAENVQQVIITLIGQTKMGKSSLVNALLGEQRARTDVLPVVDGVQSYELTTPGIPTKLTLLDTIGYNQTGAQGDQLRKTQRAVRGTDLFLLVLHARNPARQADVELLRSIKDYHAQHPDMKHPAVIAVVTHIDLLSPSLEWQPPYNWQDPKRPKEENIQQAVAAVREQLGDLAAAVIPVCVAPGKIYGVQEWLIPTISANLDDAHGVAILRCLKAEVDTRKIRRIFDQVLASARDGANVLWKSLRK